MRAESLFIAERPAAQHCAELLGRGDAPLDAIATMQPLAERFVRQLSACLAPLCGSDAPGITPRPVRRAMGAEYSTTLPALAAHCVLVTGTPDSPLFVTLDGGAILRMVDRTFGGRGETPSPLPEALPPSALLLIARLAGLIADRLSLIMGGEGTVLAQRHGTDLAELYPFAPTAELVIADFAVSEGMRAPWLFQLALSAATAASLGAGAAQARPGDRKRAAHRPDREPFGSVPVSLTATIVDTRLPLRAIAGLAPGVILPVAVARQVPLRIGGRTIATGTVGSQDDRVALQLSALV
jgi:flagellar motor switch protein FliM